MRWFAKRRATDAEELVESYLRWLEASEAVDWAYRRWTDSAPRERSVRFAGYRGALEREDHAARIYSECAARCTSAAILTPG